MRISDWSSDVCSSDLGRLAVVDAAQSVQGRTPVDIDHRDPRHDRGFRRQGALVAAVRRDLRRGRGRLPFGQRFLLAIPPRKCEADIVWHLSRSREMAVSSRGGRAAFMLFFPPLSLFLIWKTLV